MPAPKTPGRYVVDVDIYIARRKRLHTVHDPDGQPVFSAPHIMTVLEWLADNDIGQAELADDETRFVIYFQRKPSPQPEP